MNITLISPTPQDAEFWLKVRSQKSAQDNNPIGILGIEKLRSQIAESNSEIKERKSAHRFYIRSEDKKFAGVISLKDINWESGVGEIGYLIDENYQGQGIATQAVGLLLKDSFRAGVTKIKATTAVKNTASYRVLQKNGFVLEGYLKKEFLIQGELNDVYLWAVDKNLFESAQLNQNHSAKCLLKPIILSPIGKVNSTRSEVQDDNWDAETCFIELDSHNFSSEALSGLTDFSHAEVLFFMDKVDPEKVEKIARHPRNNTEWPKVGIFAQRGKNRPNQIGLTICRILKVDGLKIFLEGLDAVNGTPVLDIKPWVKEFGPRGVIEQPKWISELMNGYWDKP